MDIFSAGKIKEYLSTRFARNLSARTIMNTSSKLVGLILTALAARYLGAKELGCFALVVSLSFFFSTIIPLGIPSWLTKHLPRLLGWEKDEEARSIIKKSYEIVFILSFVLLVVTLLLTPIFGRYSVFLILAGLYGIATSIYTLGEGVYTALERLEEIAKYAIVRDISRVLIGLLLVFTIHSFISLYTAYFIPFLFYGLILYYSLSQLMKTEQMVRTLEIVRSTLPYLFYGAFSTLFFRTDIIMLSLFTTMRDVGYYRVAQVVVGAVLTFIPVYQVSFPVLSRSSRSISFLEKLKKLISVALASSTLAVLTLLITSPYLVPFIFGEEFSASIPMIVVLSLSIPAFLLYSVGVQAATLVYGDKEQLIYPSIAGVLNAILNFVLIQQIGAIGAAIATVVSFWVSFFLAVARTVKGLRCEQDYHIPF